MAAMSIHVPPWSRARLTQGIREWWERIPGTVGHGWSVPIVVAKSHVAESGLRSAVAPTAAAQRSPSPIRRRGRAQALSAVLRILRRSWRVAEFVWRLRCANRCY